MTRVIGVIAGKGGVGKTTIAINLACALGLLQKRVALVDFNFTTSHLAIELGITPTITLNNVLRKEAGIEKALYPCFNIHILPASLGLSDLNDMELENSKLKIKELLNNFEIVLLDSAPGFGREGIASIQTSDEVIFVVNPTLTAMVDVIKCKQLATQLGVATLGVVVNKYRNKKFEINPQEISNLIELPLLGVINEDENFLKSEAERTPLVFYKRNKAEEFLKLACHLAESEYRRPSFLERVRSILP